MRIASPSRWEASRGWWFLVCFGAGCVVAIFTPNGLAQQIILNGNAQQGVFIVGNVGGRIDVLGSGVAGSDGFDVKKVPSNIAEAMEEFERYSGKGEWEKAFSTLPTVVDSSSSGLVPVGNGFYLPMRSRFRQLLVGLSPGGREAYRVFNDAPARQGLMQLNAPDPNSSAITNETQTLQELFDRYFITSVGDQIGDRLGDAKFESGDFSGAADCWQAILRDFPDTTLSPMRLHVKRAIALARARRWDDFAMAASFIREKYPSENIRLGGQDIPVQTLLVEFAKSMPATGAPPRDDRTQPSPIRLPTTDEPLWQCTFADEAYLAEVERLFRSNGMAGSTMSPAMISPRVTADDQRVCLNWFGIFMVIDAQTGKLLYRSGPFSGLATNLPQVMAYGFDAVSDQAIIQIPGKDRVLVMSPSLTSTQVVRAVGGVIMRAGSGQIACYSTTDFKNIWKSEGTGLATWTLLGTPQLDGEIIYATGRSLTTTAGAANTALEMSLLAIDANVGRLLWSLPLGSMSSTTNSRGMTMMPKPVMSKVRDVIYVQTGNSAVVAVNVQARRVEWAYAWGKAAPAPAPAQAGGAVQSFVVYRQFDPLQGPSSMAFSESGLFVKDAGSASLYAIDVTGPTLKWSRPVETGSAIVGADENSVYLLGRQLDCIDIRTKDLRWSSKTPGINGGVEPLTVGSHLYVFGARGVYDLGLTNGDPKIFYGYDRESQGGSIRRVGDRLICVSNRSVTAYALPGN